ncbi:MAG: hypothetical protein JOY90_24825 [Bradyrhizobium sp.]|uniref:hypothetical protein n=1 Tax=Bradyrhizobium sp. TaxID=376 RepID=UPI001D231FF9|nr:hypothetical protein [Bradyrhizobium sp.]MBV9563640.1 hypothetical protein [Bradyrhizobium sp.]
MFSREQNAFALDCLERAVESLEPEEAAVLALLRGRLVKEAERAAAKKQRAKAA